MCTLVLQCLVICLTILYSLLQHCHFYVTSTNHCISEYRNVGKHMKWVKFSLSRILNILYTDVMSSMNEYCMFGNWVPGTFPGGKGGRCVRLTTSPTSCAEYHEIWEPKSPGTLWATPGLLRDCFTFTFTFGNYKIIPYLSDTFQYQ